MNGDMLAIAKRLPFQISTHQRVDLNLEPFLHLVEDLGIGAPSNKRDSKTLGTETTGTTDLEKQRNVRMELKKIQNERNQPCEGRGRLHRACRN